MQCLHCKSRMKKGVAPLTIDRKGFHLSWDALPAWVCEQCGEPYFEAREVESIQSVLRAVDREMELLRAGAASA